MPPQEPLGATTYSQSSNASIACRASLLALARSPELYAGWPQQVWLGTITLQPASSSSLTAAKPTLGRMMSTRQVTKSPTRGCEVRVEPAEAAVAFMSICILGRRGAALLSLSLRLLKVA